jgi:amino acid adenylation domain-containing protein
MNKDFILSSKQRAVLAKLLKERGMDYESKSLLPTVIPAPDKRYEPFPLTEIQQAYWIGRNASMELGGVATHMYQEFDSVGLDVERLNRAWQCLIERHDMLRAVIQPDGQQQILEHVPPYEIKVLDLRGQEQQSVEAQLAAVRELLSHQVLPSDQWPLFELRASLLDNQRVRVHISLDLLIADVWSMQLVARELVQLYQNPAAPLPPLELSFRDYVLAEARLRETKIYQRSLAYWDEHLANLPPAPEFPLVKNLGEVDQPHFTRRSARLDPAAWQAIKNHSAKADLTPTVVVLTAFAQVLAAWSKNPRFTLNLTLFNRLPLHTQVNEIVGDFTSLTLLSVEHVAESFEARARRVQNQLRSDLDHRYVSGVHLLRELTRKGGGASQVLMPVVFTGMLGPEGDAGAVRSLLGESVYSISQTPQVWLDHQVFEDAGALVFNWDAVDAIFPGKMLDDMFTVYCNLLERLANYPESWQETEQHTTPQAHLEQRARVNATEAPVSGKLMHDLFTEQAARQPQQAAVIAQNHTLTYAELQRGSVQIGRWLREQGARPNQLVAIVMEKGWEQVVAALGILQSGAAYLPIDPALPPERCRYLLDQGECALALTQSWLDGRLEWPESVRRLPVDQLDSLGLDDRPLESIQKNTDLAYVIYTSGSTGQPKGVMIDHRGAVNTILDINQRFGVGSQDRVLALSALNFDLSVYDIFGLLAAGGAIVMPAAGTQRDPDHWAELVARYGVTLWNTVPALMEMLVEYLGGRAEGDLGSLRLVMMSGDWIPVTLPERIWKLAPDARLISLGGATEASIWSILYPIERVDPEWTSIPYGKPMLNQQFQVLNQNLEPCPVWVPGELHIGGIGLALGYWRDENKTDERFITHPRTGERLYKTGDLGRYLPDGNLEFLGREDFQVKIRGHRIELGEIEAALLQHPLVQAGVVAAVGDTRAEKQLVAYIVPVEKPEPEKVTAGNYKPARLDQKVEAQILDPVERMKFKLKKPAVRRDTQGRQVVRLNKPQPDENSLQNYLQRRSYRRFKNEPIDLEQFSRFLSCLSPVDIPGYSLPKYRYASAGGLYPVQTYLYVKPGRVHGLSGGTYYYHPLEHSLMQINQEAHIDGKHFEGANREIFGQSAFGIFLVAQMKAITPLYGEWAKNFCMMEAGIISQQLEAVAPQHQFGLCQIGGLDFAPFRQWFELDEGHEYLHTLLGGTISPQQVTPAGLAEDNNELALFMDLLKTLDSDTSFAEGGVTTSQESGSDDLVDDIRRYLHGKLPEYMIPSAYILLEKLPLSSNGKVDRKALPSPQGGREAETTVFVAPQTETEKAIAAVWRAVLQEEKVGVHDNFFELGGNSIRMVQAHNQLQTALGKKLSLLDLFRYSTIEALAKHINAKTDSDQQDDLEEGRRIAQTRRESLRQRWQAQAEESETDG